MKKFQTIEKNELQGRQSIRLQNYDYSRTGYYYVTICTYNRIEWFGIVCENKMILNDYGHICKMCWLDLFNHYDNVSCDEFVIMPNHVHGILFIDNSQREGFKPSPTSSFSLSEIIRGFKTFSAKRINEKITDQKPHHATRDGTDAMACQPPVIIIRAVNLV